MKIRRNTSLVRHFLNERQRIINASSKSVLLFIKDRVVIFYRVTIFPFLFIYIYLTIPLLVSFSSLIQFKFVVIGLNLIICLPLYITSKINLFQFNLYFVFCLFVLWREITWERKETLQNYDYPYDVMLVTIYGNRGCTTAIWTRIDQIIAFPRQRTQTTNLEEIPSRDIVVEPLRSLLIYRQIMASCKLLCN